MILQPDPHVPYMVFTEIPGDQGRAVVCVSDRADQVLVVLERDRLNIHASFGEVGARRLAAALLEAADRVAAWEQRTGEPQKYSAEIDGNVPTESPK